MQQTLSLGTSSFAALRAADEIYVDKTAMVEKLARRRGKILLIRPRRFGKTLLLSTFESLFDTVCAIFTVSRSKRIGTTAPIRS